MWKMLEKKDNLENVKKKKIHSALISSPGRWTGNKIIFKGGLTPVSYKFLSDSTLAVNPGIVVLRGYCSSLDAIARSLPVPPTDW